MDKSITLTIVIPYHTCSAIPIAKVFLLTEATFNGQINFINNCKFVANVCGKVLTSLGI